ncbi:hypothetical protein L596_027017 [Steinernema carpocapsae]|uniref:Uncharacterized protein n=2 Tax=Steinernema carpocapsae TaxID=34508 RepID=A0A4U5M329_STECR|nr:hypothetical protein L596_027017 [Steinernema carpocapsae]
MLLSCFLALIPIIPSTKVSSHREAVKVLGGAAEAARQRWEWLAVTPYEVIKVKMSCQVNFYKPDLTSGVKDFDLKELLSVDNMVMEVYRSLNPLSQRDLWAQVLEQRPLQPAVPIPTPFNLKSCVRGNTYVVLFHERKVANAMWLPPGPELQGIQSIIPDDLESLSSESSDASDTETLSEMQEGFDWINKLNLEPDGQRRKEKLLKLEKSLAGSKGRMKHFAYVDSMIQQGRANEKRRLDDLEESVAKLREEIRFIIVEEEAFKANECSNMMRDDLSTFDWLKKMNLGLENKAKAKEEKAKEFKEQLQLVEGVNKAILDRLIGKGVLRPVAEVLKTTFQEQKASKVPPKPAASSSTAENGPKKLQQPNTAQSARFGDKNLSVEACRVNKDQEVPSTSSHGPKKPEEASIADRIREQQKKSALLLEMMVPPHARSTPQKPLTSEEREQFDKQLLAHGMTPEQISVLKNSRVEIPGEENGPSTSRKPPKAETQQSASRSLQNHIMEQFMPGYTAIQAGLQAQLKTYGKSMEQSPEEQKFMDHLMHRITTESFPKTLTSEEMEQFKKHMLADGMPPEQLALLTKTDLEDPIDMNAPSTSREPPKAEQQSADLVEHFIPGYAAIQARLKEVAQTLPAGRKAEVEQQLEHIEKNFLKHKITENGPKMYPYKSAEQEMKYAQMHASQLAQASQMFSQMKLQSTDKAKATLEVLAIITMIEHNKHFNKTLLVKLPTTPRPKAHILANACAKFVVPELVAMGGESIYATIVDTTAMTLMAPAPIQDKEMFVINFSNTQMSPHQFIVTLDNSKAPEAYEAVPPEEFKEYAMTVGGQATPSTSKIEGTDKKPNTVPDTPQDGDRDTIFWKAYSNMTRRRALGEQMPEWFVRDLENEAQLKAAQFERHGVPNPVPVRPDPATLPGQIVFITTRIEVSYPHPANPANRYISGNDFTVALLPPMTASHLAAQAAQGIQLWSRGKRFQAAVFDKDNKQLEEHSPIIRLEGYRVTFSENTGGQLPETKNSFLYEFQR